MKTIDFSTMLPVQGLALDGFERKTFIHANAQQLDWGTGWKDVLQIALYQKGPDVSEIGSTWLDNLISMNALRPYSDHELQTLGGENAFYSTLRTPGANGDHHIWSIPWLLDTRMISYRADSLSRAGVAENAAFATPEAMIDTLKRLQSRAIPYPLAMSTGANSLHMLASFIWGRGGNFRSPDLRKMALLEPEARRGLFDYFSLAKFIDPQHALKTYPEIDPLYITGQTPVTFSGQWVLQTLKNLNSEISRNTRYAPPPGVPYIGGTHLVVWRHSIHSEEVLQLIQYLTSHEEYHALTHELCIIPARKEVLNSAPFVGDPDYQLVARLIQNGRGFNSGVMWAGVEMRITNFCEQLWKDLFKNPELNLESEIERRVSSLSSMLERTLLAT